MVYGLSIQLGDSKALRELHIYMYSKRTLYGLYINQTIEIDMRGQL